MRFEIRFRLQITALYGLPTASWWNPLASGDEAIWHPIIGLREPDFPLVELYICSLKCRHPTFALWRGHQDTLNGKKAGMETQRPACAFQMHSRPCLQLLCLTPHMGLTESYFPFCEKNVSGGFYEKKLLLVLSGHVPYIWLALLAPQAHSSTCSRGFFFQA